MITGKDDESALVHVPERVPDEMVPENETPSVLILKFRRFPLVRT